MGLAVCVLAAFLIACQQQPSETETETAKTEGKAEVTKKGKTGSKQGEAKVKGPQELTVPAGTTLEVRLVQGIDTGRTDEGSAFEATLAAPLVVNGAEVALMGSTVTGKVTHVVSSGRLSRPAELSLTLNSLTPKGEEKVAISTNTWATKAESHKKGNIEKIGGGAAAGALIGALAGGKKGAAIGAGVGAGGGTAVAEATGKKEIVLPSETKLSFKLKAPVTLTVSR